MQSQALRVHSISFGARDVHLFDLRAPEGNSLPSFRPGAHVRIRMDGGMVRSYSLVNDPDETDRYVIGVQRDRNSRGGSTWMHESVRVGQILEVEGPYNTFPLEDSAEHSVFIAGGIGITPICGMIRRLDSLDRSWQLHYRTRTADVALFVDILNSARREHSIHISFGDQVGREAFNVSRIVKDAPQGAHLYCCGPTPMIDVFLKATERVPPAQVHIERFQAEEAPATDGGFTVRLVRSDRTIEMAKGQSILSAVLALGIDAPYSCQEGICGECETRVVSGIPDHRDLFLTQAEKAAGDRIMICCSGSLTPILELDL